MMPLLLLAWACSGEGAAPPKKPAPPKVAPAEGAPQVNKSAGRRGPDEAPSGPAAPTREVYGLKLGITTGEEVDAWLAERQLQCPGKPAPARTTVHYKCEGELPLSLVADRKVKGKLSQILIARLDNGPVHHYSNSRRYSLPDDVVADYHSAIEAISARLGTPFESKRIEDMGRLSQKVAHFATRWRFGDLEVSVVVLKAAGDYIAVNEMWNVPGVERLAAARGSGGGHGGGRPAGWNPHVLAAPSGPAPR